MKNISSIRRYGNFLEQNIYINVEWKEVRGLTDHSEKKACKGGFDKAKTKDSLPSLTMSYGMLKCPIDSSSTEPGSSLISPPFQNDNIYTYICIDHSK